MIRISYLGAPGLLFAYGIAHLINDRHGIQGPGAAWTIGHVLFLGALVCFGAAMIGARRAVNGHRTLTAIAVTVGMCGISVFARSVVVDLLVGFRSVDRIQMNQIYPDYHRFPLGIPTGVVTVIDQIGPPMLILGLLALITGLALQRRIPWWSPIALLAGFASVTINLNLLPLAGALIATALAPMLRCGPVKPAALYAP